MLIKVPGSKSITTRARALAALSGSEVTLQNAAVCDDSKYMLKGLMKIGFQEKEPIKIFTGNAGTATRFLTAIASITDKKTIIAGDKHMATRPIKPLVDALNKLGAKIKCPTGCPPVMIYDQPPIGGEIKIPGDISSQYITALLMIAPFLEEPTTIKITGQLASKPYVEMTIKMMKDFGLKVANKNFKEFTIKPQNAKPPKTYHIEGDCSSASYLGAFAALNPKSPVTLENISENSLQGDIKFLQYLKKMGCTIPHSGKKIKIQGPRQLKSLGTIDMNETPDLVMTFAVLAMFTEGETRITNIANLRIKETDRLAALENEIKKFGIKVRAGKDFIAVTGGPLDFNKKIAVETYDDHRIAMCFGILLNKFPNLKIKNPECVRKSYPDFWKHMSKLQKVK